MISQDDIRARILERFPDARVEIQDLTGGADHYRVEVVSSAFEGKTPIERHRMVYAAFDDVLGGALHALSLVTKTP